MITSLSEQKMHLNKASKLIRYILISLSLGTSQSFADSNYSKEVEKFAEALVFTQYQQSFELTGEQKLYIKAIPLSKRLNLAECSEPLQGHIVDDKIKRKTAIKVSCEGNTPWDTTFE